MDGSTTVGSLRSSTQLATESLIEIVDRTLPRTLAIRLTPKASADRIGETRALPDGTEQLAVYVNAVPENGKANEAMLRLLAKHLRVPVSRLTIIRGATSRNKIIRVQ